MSCAEGSINLAAAQLRKGLEVWRLRGSASQAAVAQAAGERSGTRWLKCSGQHGCALVPASQGGGTPTISRNACALYSSRLQQDGGGQVARGRVIAAGNPAAAGGSCGRRPGSSGPRLAQCCPREALLGTGEKSEDGVAFPGASYVLLLGPGSGSRFARFCTTLRPPVLELRRRQRLYPA